LSIGEENVNLGRNATACSFYSSQGRKSSIYNDCNETLVDDVYKEFNISSLEMETFHIFDLSEISNGKVICGAACLVLAQRSQKSFIDLDLKHKMELEMGKVGLETIIGIKLKNEMDPKDFIFKKNEL